MSRYQHLLSELDRTPKMWVVTGAAGFIGSHLVEQLLLANQHVVGIDNLATGNSSNLQDVKDVVGQEQWQNFRFFKADIVSDVGICYDAFDGADYILHQAALGSVPRSVANPKGTHEANVTGFLNVLLGARVAKVKRIVFASSSSVYGDNEDMPKIEARTGSPLSPYAATKVCNEAYASAFSHAYGIPTVGLRYFNVFGPRQDPSGEYAAVIPRWIISLIRNENVYINGDGSVSRDFCYVSNAVQANLLAATGDLRRPSEIFNVALNARTSLNALFDMLVRALEPNYPHLAGRKPLYRQKRPGDINHSQADISKAIDLLGYCPMIDIQKGLTLALEWYIRREQLYAS